MASTGRVIGWIFLLGVCLGAVGPLRADSLDDAFAQPPAVAKPRTWWHWIGGNISREGITADLESMQRIGLGGAQIFTAAQSNLRGPVLFMTPQWRGLVQHALAESNRLGLEIAMENQEGWSESGGPAIKPADSMQQIVSSESHVLGGRRIDLRSLPQPWTELDYYGDIALAAFPASPADSSVDAPLVTVSPQGVTGTQGRDGRVRPLATFPGPTWDTPQWIELSYSTPHTFSSVHVGISPLLWREAEDTTTPTHWELQASGDGTNFTRVCDIALHGTLTFPEVTARYFRLWMPTRTIEAPDRIVITEFVLGGPRVDRAESRSGLVVDRLIGEFSSGNIPEADIIPDGGWIDLTGRTEWDAPPGRWTILRIGHTSTNRKNGPAMAETEGLECDKLSRAAVEKHFEQDMLGPVIADAGPLAGTTLKYVLCDSWEAGCENWTPLMRGEFKARRGYDPWPWLPALAGRVVGSVDETERFLWDYRRTIADLVAENHYGVIQELAHRHNMGLYAEATGIHIPTVADQLQCKGRTDVPMGEFWVDMPWGTDDTKEAASAAHIYGQNIAGAESFTAYPFAAGWARDPYSLKAQGDRELCLGINQIIFHEFAHQPWMDRRPGMSLWLWGTQFNRMNTWWEPAAAWISYLTRSQALLQRGVFAADLCYYYGEGAPVDFQAALLAPQPPAGFDYDACNAEVLLTRMSVRDGRIVLPSGMSYRVLVLPDTDRMTVPVLRKVQELVRAGATVYGPRPVKSPSLDGYPACDREVADIAGEVWGGCNGTTVTSHGYGAGRVVWGRSLAEVLGVAPDFSSPVQDMRYIHRHDGDAEIYFVSNQQARDLVADCTFRVDGKVPELWHPDTGRCETAAAYVTRDGCTTVPIHFDPIGSVFVVFRRSAAAADPVVAIRETHEIFAPAGTVAVGATPLVEPPAAVNGAVLLSVWQPGAYTLTTASGRTLRAEAAEVPAPLELAGPWRISFPPKLGAPPQVTFDHLMSWTEATDFGVKYFSGTATYVNDFAFPAEAMGPARRWYLDLGTVKNLADVSLNGREVAILWKEPFRVDVTGALQPGLNHLEVKVTNLWPNRLIGDQLLPPEKRITWMEWKPYESNSPLLVSGILGPVVIRTARQIVAEPVAEK